MPIKKSIKRNSSTKTTDAKEENYSYYTATKKVKDSYQQNPSTCVYTKRYDYLKKQEKQLMNEFYEAIEQKIKESGYTGAVDGYELYNEVCDFIEEKENGTCIFLSKKQEDVVYEYKVDIMDDNFNLSYVNIKDGGSEYHIDFDC